jgi:CRP/FNR family transcriptional regulator
MLEPSVLLHLDAERFAALAVRRPELNTALVDELITRLRLAYRALAAHAFLSVRTRVAIDLIERANMRGPMNAGLQIDVTQQSLADATGSVREVVSRALGQLRSQGVVARNGDGVTVLDPEGLMRAAGL